MKVTGARPAGAPTGVRPPPRASDGAFAPSAAEDAGAAAPATRSSSLGAVSSLDALLALQETLGPLERRRRAVRRAGHLLDELDALKLALLDDDGSDGSGRDGRGQNGGGPLARLQAVMREARQEIDDAGLEDVLEQVEIRAAVELAKRERLHR